MSKDSKGKEIRRNISFLKLLKPIPDVLKPIVKIEDTPPILAELNPIVPERLNNDDQTQENEDYADVNDTLPPLEGSYVNNDDSNSENNLEKTNGNDDDNNSENNLENTNGNNDVNNSDNDLETTDSGLPTHRIKNSVVGAASAILVKSSATKTPKSNSKHQAKKASTDKRRSHRRTRNLDPVYNTKRAYVKKLTMGNDQPVDTQSEDLAVI